MSDHKPGIDPDQAGMYRFHAVKALGWSISGLATAFRHETAFRQETALFCILAPPAFWVGENGTEQALLLGSLLLIFIVELLNTAVEAVVDRIGAERHPLSGRAKDLASAAVLLALLNAAVVWGLVFFN